MEAIVENGKEFARTLEQTGLLISVCSPEQREHFIQLADIVDKLKADDYGAVVLYKVNDVKAFAVFNISSIGKGVHERVTAHIRWKGGPPRYTIALMKGFIDLFPYLNKIVAAVPRQFKKIVSDYRKAELLEDDDPEEDKIIFTYDPKEHKAEEPEDISEGEIEEVALEEAAENPEAIYKAMIANEAQLAAEGHEVHEIGEEDEYSEEEGKLEERREELHPFILRKYGGFYTKDEWKEYVKTYQYVTYKKEQIELLAKTYGSLKDVYLPKYDYCGNKETYFATVENAAKHLIESKRWDRFFDSPFESRDYFLTKEYRRKRPARFNADAPETTTTGIGKVDTAYFQDIKEAKAVYFCLPHLYAAQAVYTFKTGEAAAHIAPKPPGKAKEALQQLRAARKVALPPSPSTPPALPAPVTPLEVPQSPAATPYKTPGKKLKRLKKRPTPPPSPPPEEETIEEVYERPEDVSPPKPRRKISTPKPSTVKVNSQLEVDIPEREETIEEEYENPPAPPEIEPEACTGGLSTGQACQGSQKGRN
jgi:hypothetical protein